MDRYAVVGNPISHSLSPMIHHAFAQQTGQAVSYEALLIETGEFELQIKRLQELGVLGLNVTVPFKQDAWHLARKRSPRAELAGAVNTLIFQPDGGIDGDTTDGVGLLTDLLINHKALIRNRKVLVLGAGGAVRGVLGPLLLQNPSELMIANRTREKAEELALLFAEHGDIDSCHYDELGATGYDLIINGTSAGLTQDIPPIPDSILNSNSFCYDMMYNVKEPTAFTRWAHERGAVRASDGLGMLVEQAAESFKIWRGVRPETGDIIRQLRKVQPDGFHVE